MDSESVLQLVILVILIVLSGFFSSAETAMTTVSRIRLRGLEAEGNKTAALLLRIVSDPAKMLSTILIGNNIVNMAASALMTTFTIHTFGSIYIGIATGLLTLFILLFGEITPKTLASIHSEEMALRYARPVYVLMIILTPVVFLVTALANGILRLLGTDTNAGNVLMTERDLRTLVDVSEQDGVIENDEKKLIYNVVDFGDSVAKNVMVPRIDMSFVEVNAGYEELMEIFRESRHTRFPVFEGDTDHIVGIVNIKDLLLMPSDSVFSIRDLLRPAYFTYEYKPTADLLKEMRKASVNLAIVLDEYGATAGLVTLEDLLEELVGEIRDEYDEDEKEPLTEIIPGREYLAAGDAKLDDLNEALGLHLRSEEYDSLSGYILEKLDSLPHEGETIELPDGFRLVVEKIQQNRIISVQIWLPETS